MTRQTTRPGMTLLELIAVMTVILILGAILIPTLSAFRGDTRVKAAVDTFTGRVAEGRVRAMEQGRPYLLSVHQDGTRFRLAPFSVASADTAEPMLDTVLEDSLPAGVTAAVVQNEDAPIGVDAEGWLPAATFQTDGTCREDNVVLEVAETGTRSLFVHLRGLTGVISVRSSTTDALP